MAEFPGNPRQRPRVAEKTAWSSDEVQQRSEMMSHHSLVVNEEGPRGVTSREEVAEIIEHHFGLRRYDFHIRPSSP
jgi:hypothetical protein